MPETIILEKKDTIAWISFNRPQAMNSFNQQMSKDLLEVVRDVEQDSSIRAVVLQGAGDLFMAGGDIGFFAENIDSLGDSPEGREIFSCLNQAISILHNLPKPVLAGVHGSCAGVGISFMLAADLIIAAEDTKFNLAYTGLGITPDGGASYALPRAIGLQRALQLVLLSEPFTANDAEKYGLVNWVVSSAELPAILNKTAQRLANGPTKSFANCKRLLRQSLNNDLEQQLELEAESFLNMTKTQDFKSAVLGFVNKQAVQFKGE